MVWKFVNALLRPFGLCLLLRRGVVFAGIENDYRTYRAGLVSVRLGRHTKRYTTTAGAIAQQFAEMDPDKVIQYRCGDDVRFDRSAFA